MKCPTDIELSQIYSAAVDAVDTREARLAAAARARSEGVLSLKYLADLSRGLRSRGESTVIVASTDGPSRAREGGRGRRGNAEGGGHEVWAR